MSYELTDSRESLGQFASNQGYSDLIEALELLDQDESRFPALHELVETGASKQPSRVKEELVRLARNVSDDVHDTALAMAGLIAPGAKTLTVTDGEGREPVPLSLDKYQANRVQIKLSCSLAKALRNPGHLRNMLNAYATQTGQDLASRIKSLGPNPSKSEVLAEVEATSWAPLAGMIQPHLRDMAIRSGIEALESTGASTPATRYKVFLANTNSGRDRAAEIVGMRYNSRNRLEPDPAAQYDIGFTARKELNNLIDQAYDDGMDTEGIAGMVENARCFSPARLNTIADTEINRARHAGKRAGFEAADVEMVEWVMEPHYAGKSKVECECPSLAAGSPYRVDEIPELPHPNCRCELRAVVHD